MTQVFYHGLGQILVFGSCVWKKSSEVSLLEKKYGTLLWKANINQIMYVKLSRIQYGSNEKENKWINKNQIPKTINNPCGLNLAPTVHLPFALEAKFIGRLLIITNILSKTCSNGALGVLQWKDQASVMS